MRRPFLAARLAQVAWLATACNDAPSPPPPALEVAGPVRDAEVIDAARRATVLLVTRRPDGKVGYGAGVLLEGRGLALTNLHVVANASSLRAMLFDAERTSYTPTDGGLARYLFENEKALVPAELRRADPVLDLAVVEIDADTSAFPKLVWRTAPAQPGEPVRAVGHPAETVWSFTAGVVSAVHSGALQTDAAINTGNSGGPLIDAAGALLGINTSKLLGAVQNIGFARPIGMAMPLVAAAAAPAARDRSTVEKAYTTCSRAAEHGQEAVECIDALTHVVYLNAVTRELWRRSPRLAGRPAHEYSLEEAREMLRLSQRVFNRADDDAWLAQWADENGVSLAQLKEAVAGAKSDTAYVPKFEAELLQRTGLKIDQRNPQSVSDVMRMGTRIERVVRDGDDRAWLHISGRNTDGSSYRLAELWVRRDDGWAQVRVISAADEATRPDDFPLTDTTWDQAIERDVAMNLRVAERAP